MERFGLSYKYYQKIETGKANTTLNTLEKIARALDTDVTDFFILPLDESREINELAASVGKIIRNKDRKSARKVNLFIREIL